MVDIIEKFNVDEETHKPVAILDGWDGTALKEWLKKNKQVPSSSEPYGCR